MPNHHGWRCSPNPSRWVLAHSSWNREEYRWWHISMPTQNLELPCSQSQAQSKAFQLHGSKIRRQIPEEPLHPTKTARRYSTRLPPIPRKSRKLHNRQNVLRWQNPGKLEPVLCRYLAHYQIEINWILELNSSQCCRASGLSIEEFEDYGIVVWALSIYDDSDEFGSCCLVLC